jgi:hypothetical protein
MSSINTSTHIFFCNETDCSNMTTYYGATCYDCCRDRCLGCGDMGATVLGSDYCHTCMSVRDHPCNTAFVSDEPHCTCDDSGRMCDFCSEEYKELCRGCGEYSHLWVDDMYCRSCYVDRHGYEFPPKVRVSDELKDNLLANLPTEGDKWSFTPAPPPLPPSPKPRHTSLESMRAEIAEIEVRLRGGLTKGQRDDWVWLLQNRRADLAEAEKEMWAGYDQDDLRKLDRANRY